MTNIIKHKLSEREKQKFKPYKKKGYVNKLELESIRARRWKKVVMKNGKPYRRRKVHVRGYDRTMLLPVRKSTYAFIKGKRKRKRK